MIEGCQYSVSIFTIDSVYLELIGSQAEVIFQAAKSSRTDSIPVLFVSEFVPYIQLYLWRQSPVKVVHNIDNNQGW